MVQKVAIYCRVSTADQSCSRQERELLAYAQKAGYEVVGVWKETASGSQNNRTQRKQVISLAQARQIDGVLVTCSGLQTETPRLANKDFFGSD